MYRLFTLITLFFFLSFGCLKATGPSYIQVQIKPISINAKKEILCRTRYLQNPMGAHDWMPVEYGVCILANDTILEFKTFDLKHCDEYPDIDTCLANQKEWDERFDSPFDMANLSLLEKRVAEQYAFSESNVEKYYKNDTLSLVQLQELTGLDAGIVFQKSLHGAKGYYDTIDTDRNQPLVNVLYDFGNIIIIENTDDADEDINQSACFDYINPILPEVGYDISSITGVVFLKN